VRCVALDGVGKVRPGGERMVKLG